MGKTKSNNKSKQLKQVRNKSKRKALERPENENLVVNEINNELINDDDVYISKPKKIENNRCRKCFITHWPYQKFCRWVNAKIDNAKIEISHVKELNPLPEETVRLVNVYTIRNTQSNIQNTNTQTNKQIDQ